MDRWKADMIQQLQRINGCAVVCNNGTAQASFMWLAMGATYGVRITKADALENGAPVFRHGFIQRANPYTGSYEIMRFEAPRRVDIATLFGQCRVS